MEGHARDVLLCKDNTTIKGLLLESGETILCKMIIITTGTFLSGEMHIGMKSFSAGRMGEGPATALSLSLAKAGFQLGRMRTGTPPRLLKASINFSQLEAQPSEFPPKPFSYLNDVVSLQDHLIDCHITKTNLQTHKLIRDNLHLTIHIKEEVKGPRYCPSIESKIIRFGDREGHQVWLEQEGIYCLPKFNHMRIFRVTK